MAQASPPNKFGNNQPVIRFGAINGRILMDQQVQKVVSTGNTLTAGEEMVTNDVFPVYRVQNEEQTIEQPVYEAFDFNLVKERVVAGLVLEGPSDSYSVKRVLQHNLFEVESKGSQERLTMKIYDADEAYKFQNEVEKLQLLSEVMEDMGVQEQNFLVSVLDQFACTLSQSEGKQALEVQCVVMEHLELSLAEFFNA